MDADGNERKRLEGYLPPDEFQAFLELGLARVAFMRKDWADAEKHFNSVLEKHPDSQFAPEATYYAAVCRYSASHDSSELAEVAVKLNERFPGNQWQLRSLPWLKEKSESTSG